MRVRRVLSVLLDGDDDDDDWCISRVKKKKKQLSTIKSRVIKRKNGQKDEWSKGKRTKRKKMAIKKKSQ